MTVPAIGQLLTVASSVSVSTTAASYTVVLRETDSQLWPLPSPSSGLIIYIDYTSGDGTTVSETDFSVTFLTNPTNDTTDANEFYEIPSLAISVPSPGNSVAFTFRRSYIRPSRLSWESALKLTVSVGTVGSPAAGTYSIAVRALNTTVFVK